MFGGMWRWSASWRTVARVFAGALWCRDILFGYKIIALAKTPDIRFDSVGAGCDTRRGSPDGTRQGRPGQQPQCRLFIS